MVSAHVEEVMRRNLDAHERDLCGWRGAEHDAHDLAVALREAWADNDRIVAMVEWMAEVIVDARDACQRAESIEPIGSPEWVESGIAMRTTALREVRAILDRERNAHPFGLSTPSAVAGNRELAERAEQAEAAIARVRAICTRADNDEFHSPYQVVEFIRDALDGEACPFCTREAQAECESTGGRCSEEDEIDAVLDDRPDLNPYEALIAGLREARAEVERLDRDARAVAGRCLHYEARAEKAEAAIDRVRALCDEAEADLNSKHVCGPDCYCGCIYTDKVRAALGGGDE